LISTNASPTEISKWKNNPAVKKCHDKLLEPINEYDDETTTYMVRIMEKVFIDPNKASDILIAYAMSVCDIFLDPKNEHIQITKSIIKEKFEVYLVSFAILRK
jgi:hypothetical protein